MSDVRRYEVVFMERWSRRVWVDAVSEKEAIETAKTIIEDDPATIESTSPDMSDLFPNAMFQEIISAGVDQIREAHADRPESSRKIST